MNITAERIPPRDSIAFPFAIKTLTETDRKGYVNKAQINPAEIFKIGDPYEFGSASVESDSVAIRRDSGGVRLAFG